MPQTLADLKRANADLKRENAILKRENEKMLKSKTAKAAKKPRAPSAYNIFMGKAMKELKETHPEHKAPVIMGLAAEKWKEEKLKK